MELKAGDIVSFVAKDATFGMAKLLRIDTHADLPVPQPVYHFLIYGLRNLFPPNAAYIQDAKPFIGHLPIMKDGVEKSGCVFIGFQDVDTTELDGYHIWREAFFAGEAGVFDLTLDEAIAVVLEALGKSFPNGNF
ncbi:MAG: hypothetical protein HY22_09450 [[Candidatus Thermochlorobacteriaceae] bacterium GBChlB]|jgi:hypothetical protein|nr:MAG: hypothetical protein HY22_09450 [[Candidatus Thermochlorobacteriaceae] bacterium GBChlB]